jgi:hypothetical protein
MLLFVLLVVLDGVGSRSLSVDDVVGVDFGSRQRQSALGCWQWCRSSFVDNIGVIEFQ